MLCPILNDLSDDLSSLPGQCSPECPGLTGLLSCGSCAAADLRKGWQHLQCLNCCLIGYSNLIILLRGHLKLAFCSRRCFHTAVETMLRECLLCSLILYFLNFLPLLLAIYLSSHFMFFSLCFSDYINNFISSFSVFPKYS